MQINIGECRACFYVQLYFSQGGSLMCYLDEKCILKLFPLSSCHITIRKKKPACYRPFRNGHLVRVCTEKVMNHPYRESDT